jgi:hypothetical protein
VNVSKSNLVAILLEVGEENAAVLLTEPASTFLLRDELESNMLRIGSACST